MTKTLSSEAAIDFAHLDLYTAGDRTLTCEVLRLFREQSATLIEALKHAEDNVLFKQTAHALKGATRAIGAWEAAKRAEAVERAAPFGAEERRRAVEELERALASVTSVALAFEKPFRSV